MLSPAPSTFRELVALAGLFLSVFFPFFHSGVSGEIPFFFKLKAKRGVGFDTTTAGGRLVFHMMAALSEFERSIIVERTKAGMSAARRRGKRLGRPVKLTPDHLDHARTLLASGEHTRRSVAKLLGVNESTLRRALKD